MKGRLEKFKSWCVNAPKRKTKIKIYHPKTIKEAIDDLQTFLECDMWSKFYPEHKIPVTKNGKKGFLKLCRKDVFKNEKEFYKYLDGHFNILRKQIKRMQIKKIKRKFKK